MIIFAYHITPHFITDNVRYQKFVKKLIYLSQTRPDIAYALSVVRQFMHDPKNTHIEVGEHILKYLKHALRKELIFKKHDHLRIDGYSNADWEGSTDNRRLTSGYFTFVGRNFVTWRCKK